MKMKKIVKMLVMTLIICLMLIPFNSRVQGSSKEKYVKVTVSPGDTIWSIALDNINDNDDVRKLVFEIKKVNKLDSAIITPGQELIIPE